jgi:hypothetical protein
LPAPQALLPSQHPLATHAPESPLSSAACLSLLPTANTSASSTDHCYPVSWISCYPISAACLSLLHAALASATAIATASTAFTASLPAPRALLPSQHPLATPAPEFPLSSAACLSFLPSAKTSETSTDHCYPVSWISCYPISAACLLLLHAAPGIATATATATASTAFIDSLPVPQALLPSQHPLATHAPESPLSSAACLSLLPTANTSASSTDHCYPVSWISCYPISAACLSLLHAALATATAIATASLAFIDSLPASQALLPSPHPLATHAPECPLSSAACLSLLPSANTSASSTDHC